MHRIIFVVLFVAAVAGCRAAPIENPTDIAFAPPAGAVQSQLTLQDYRDAIVRAGAQRGWTFQDAGPGRLTGSVVVRGKHFAAVDVLFDTQDFTINYKDSRNLNYSASRREIHPNYNAWVSNLQKDIQAEVARLKSS